MPTCLVGVILFAWALLAYLTAEFSGDRLAEGIQVQRLLDDPGLVLSYPGQGFGGVVEYPFMLAMEALSPQNPYALTLLRLFLVPIAGMFTCLICRRLFPEASLWLVVLGAAVSPAVLHGPMIVNALYPMSWTLGLAGALVACRALDRGDEGAGPYLLSGLLIGLAIYEHPAIVMLVLPLLMMFVARWPEVISGRRLAATVVGSALGLLPLLVSYAVPHDGPRVWNPVGLHAPPLGKMFGFGGADDDWIGALVPNGWGLLNGPVTAFSADWIQWTLYSLLIAGLCGSLGVASLAILQGARSRHSVSPGGVVAIGWATALIVTLGLMSVVQPVWFYGTGLGFLVWITVGELPFVLPKWLGSGVVALFVVAAGSTTLRTSGETINNVAALTKANRDAVSAGQRQARDLAAAGAQVIYGDYWEVVPLGYFSGGALAPVSTTFNRFALPDASSKHSTVMVAVKLTSTTPEGQVAAQTMASACARTAQPDAASGFGLFRCPIAAILPV